MSLTPVVFDRPARMQAQGYGLGPVGLMVIGLAFVVGVQTMGWRDTGRLAWEAAALLFLLPFTIDSILRLFPCRICDRLDDWAPRIELFFIAVFSGSWFMAIGPALLAGERIPSLALAGSSASCVLLFAMLTNSPRFFPSIGRIRERIYGVATAGIWTILFFSFLDRYAGPHATDFFLPTILLMMVGAVLLRFAATFQGRHPALFD